MPSLLGNIPVSFYGMYILRYPKCFGTCDLKLSKGNGDSRGEYPMWEIQEGVVTPRTRPGAVRSILVSHERIPLMGW